MAYLDRDQTPLGGNGISVLTPVVKSLLIANIAIYFLDLLLFDHAIRDWGQFTVATGWMEMKIWQCLTFQFLHGSIGHLLANCIPLYFFGPFMERWWGARRFVAFYLICGLSGALATTSLMAAGWLDYSINTSMVGASAGIYGILIGVACIAPAMQVRLLIPPITLTMRQLAIAFLAISGFFVLSRVGTNTGGEAAHLGGALLGFLLVRLPQALDWVHGAAMPIRQGQRTPRPVVGTKIRPRTRIPLGSDDEVDRILDKISQDGFQSLTDAERETLHQAAQSKSSE